MNGAVTNVWQKDQGCNPAGWCFWILCKFFLQNLHPHRGKTIIPCWFWICYDLFKWQSRPNMWESLVSDVPSRDVVKSERAQPDPHEHHQTTRLTETFVRDLHARHETHRDLYTVQIPYKHVSCGNRMAWRMDIQNESLTLLVEADRSFCAGFTSCNCFKNVSWNDHES